MWISEKHLVGTSTMLSPPPLKTPAKPPLKTKDIATLYHQTLMTRPLAAAFPATVAMPGLSSHCDHA